MNDPVIMRRTLRLLAPCLALALLAGCNKSPQNDAAKIPHYDLSPATNARYLADFAAKPGVFKTEDGLEYRILKAGTGKAPQSGADMVTVKYKGALINGKVFDEHDDAVTATAGKTATFPAGALIPGWVEALSLMKEGDQWELVLPSDLGYGPEGAGKDIPGNQTLVFEMTLVSVQPAQ
jgi:FKBP-type peptidyl-prolyl cis-trans isomerase